MKMCVSVLLFLVTLHSFASTAGMGCDKPHPRSWAETPPKSKTAPSVNSAVWVLRQQTEFRGRPHIHVFIAGTREVSLCECTLLQVEGWGSSPQQETTSLALEHTAESCIQELWSMDKETDTCPQCTKLTLLQSHPLPPCANGEDSEEPQAERPLKKETF